MTPEITSGPELSTVPAFTPSRRPVSLARHWIETGRRSHVLAAVQLLLESDDPRLLSEARDMLAMLVEG